MKYVVLIAWAGCLWIITWMLCFLWHIHWAKAEKSFERICDFLEEHILP